MPKDEFDFEDPLELNGVAFFTEQDTSAEMAECFAEEFLRMGYNHKQVLALFRNPHYVGPNLVLENKGEGFVRDIIAQVFARWGRPIEWPTVLASIAGQGDVRSPAGAGGESDRFVEPGLDPGGALVDPLGNPVPKLNL